MIRLWSEISGKTVATGFIVTGTHRNSGMPGQQMRCMEQFHKTLLFSCETLLAGCALRRLPTQKSVRISGVYTQVMHHGSGSTLI